MAQEDEYIQVCSPADMRVKGTRVGIEHILSAYLAGSLPEEIAVEFPTITLEQIHGVIAYYLRNQADVDAYVARWRNRSRKLRTEQAERAAPEAVQRLRRIAEEQVAG